MSEEEKKPENTGDSRADKPQRDENGRFVKGQSGNPKGKPKGALSITAAIKKKLKEVPEGRDKTYLEFMVESIMKKAIVDGDTQLLKQIWAYIDGMPLQKTEVSGGEGNPVIVEYIPVSQKQSNVTESNQTAKQNTIDVENGLASDHGSPED